MLRIKRISRPRYVPVTEVIDGVWGEFGSWAPTSDYGPCIDGFQTRPEQRTRILVVLPQNGGVVVGGATETRDSDPQACEVDPPADPVYYTITGTVLLEAAPLAGVAFTVIAPLVSTVTDASGNYSLTVPEGWSGILTPTLTGYTFTPEYHTYSNVVANDTGEDFTAEDAEPLVDSVWFEDALPAGSIPTGVWTWVATNPTPFSGTQAHQSSLSSGFHQHYFNSATATLPVEVGDKLFVYVYLDPANPPTEVKLQWNDGSWLHRAYWSASATGVEGPERRYMGALPALGQWVRLEVPASAVGLEGSTLNGMAFTLVDGRATWDRAGIASADPVIIQPIPFDELPIPSLADETATYNTWLWANTAPTVTEPVTDYYVFSPDIHNDTEGDDLWSYLAMYRRTGNAVYMNRARQWARYFKEDYRICVGNADETFCSDRTYGLDHLYGWGLIDWYLHTGDLAALTEAENIATEMEAMYQPPWASFSCYAYGACTHWGTRGPGRQLILLSRLSELRPAWIGFRDKVIDYVLSAPEWDATYGMYWLGQEATDGNHLGAGGYAAGGRVTSSFMTGVLVEGLYQAWRVLPAGARKTAMLGKIVAIAGFVNTYGLSTSLDYTGSGFGIVGGVKWHNYDGTGFVDPAYTTSLVNTLVYGYKLTGDAALLARAKYFFNRGTKGARGTGARLAADTQVHHYVDSTFDSSMSNIYLNYNKGELQYTYRLFEGGVAGTGPVVEVVITPPAQTPAAPTIMSIELDATNPDTQLNMSWNDPANNETGFKIERAQLTGVGASPFTQFATRTANIVNLYDPGRTPATTYSYRVRAYNSYGDSAYSPTATATTSAASAIPLPPTPAPTGTVPTYLAGLAVGAWREVSNTAPSRVVPPMVGGINGERGWGAYSGAWWDNERGIMGMNNWGGHGDGWWNGGLMINFSADEPTSVLTFAGSAEADATNASDGYYRDGKPASRHTYYSLHWHRQLNRVLIVGAAAIWDITGSASNRHVDGFHPHSGLFDGRGTHPFYPGLFGADATICVDPVTGNVYFWSTSQIAVYNYVNRVWASFSAPNQLYGQSAIDDRRRRLVYFGVATGSSVGPTYIDLNTLGSTPVTGFTSATIEADGWGDKQYSPCFVKHPTTAALDMFVIRGAIEGGGRIWKISNLETAASMTKSVLPQVGGDSIPGAEGGGASGGRYSRFGVFTNINGSGIDIAVDLPRFATNAWVYRLR